MKVLLGCAGALTLAVCASTALAGQPFAVDAEALIEEGRGAVDESTELYGMIRVVRDHLAPEERIRIIEMLWEVAYADGDVDDYEANLVRRVAGLLYVPDRDSGAARKRVEGART